MNPLGYRQESRRLPLFHERQALGGGDGFAVEVLRRLLRGEHRGDPVREEAVIFVGDEHADLGDAVPVAERQSDHPREEQRETQHGNQT